MSKLIYFVSSAVIAILIAMVGIKTEAATDIQIHENTNYKVVGHQYQGMYTSRDSDIYSSYTVEAAQADTLHIYNFEWPVSIDIFVKGISSFADTDHFSGYIAFPVTFTATKNPNIDILFNNMVSDYPTNAVAGSLKDNDFNIFLTSQAGNGITYNMFSQGGTYWVSVLFDNVAVSSFYRDTANTAYLSVNFIVKGGFSYLTFGREDFLVDVYYPDFFTVQLYSNALTSTWVSKCLKDVPLATQIAQGINAATDIDTIITLLNTIAGDTMTLTWVVDNIENLDAVLSAMYTYIQNEHTFFEGNLNSLKQYLLNIDGHIVSGSYQLDDILDILMASNQSVASLGTVLYNLSTTRTIANNLQILLQRVVAALGGPSANIWGDQTQFAREVTSHWIQIIREALSDFEIRIDIDNDNSIHIETTENQIVNIYNDHTIIQNFENNISLNFESYMSNIPFDLVNPSTGGPPGFSGTVTSGKNLIERMFNALGDYSYLVIVTLLVGLVAALIGPINKFIAAKVNKK